VFLKLDPWLLCKDKRSAFCSSLCRRLAWLCWCGSPGTEKVVIVTTTMTFHVPYTRKYNGCTKRALRGGRGTTRPILSIGNRRGEGGERHTPAASLLEKGTWDSLHIRGGRSGWVKKISHLDSKSEMLNLWRVALPTELSRPPNCRVRWGISWLNNDCYFLQGFS
jgi:hypothetical protein